jgi:hypothetical protein
MENSIVSILEWINDTPMAEAIRGTEWAFPALETIHVLAIVFVVGSITRLDMRLMGLVWQDRAVTDVSDEMLPYTWTAFVIATIFGVLLWTAKPMTYFGIAFFDVKMLLMACAAVNMLVFQLVTFKSVAQWNNDPIPPAAARFAGFLSMAFWVGVVICGRLIGFV